MGQIERDCCWESGLIAALRRSNTSRSSNNLMMSSVCYLKELPFKVRKKMWLQKIYVICSCLALTLFLLEERPKVQSLPLKTGLRESEYEPRVLQRLFSRRQTGCQFSKQSAFWRKSHPTSVRADPTRPGIQCERKWVNGEYWIQIDSMGSWD